MRPFAAAYILVAADYREGRLKQKQEGLIEQWGAGVATAYDDALPASEDGASSPVSEEAA